jgi:outer membrane protein OmpA-like peptidoglycan-associated protein
VGYPAPTPLHLPAQAPKIPQRKAMLRSPFSIGHARPTLTALAAICALLASAPAEAKKKKPAEPGSSEARAPSPPQSASVFRVEIDKSHALDEHWMGIKMSRPPGKVRLTVLTEEGQIIADEEKDFTGRSPGDSLLIRWQQGSEQPIGEIHLHMEDRDEHFIEQQYSAWYVPIPHEEVNFRTDSSEIDASEVAKLDGAFTKIQEVLAKDKARDHKNLTLYIAGHTDTVGNAGYNLKLSQARAQSIARWFRQKGVRIPIAYEGFGETALRVATPDQTDEPRNRRADYILADDPPPLKAEGFKPAWKRVN